MGYSYKKYSDIAGAEAMIEHIKNGGISNGNTAYRELVTIKNEWPGTSVAYEAEALIDERYSQYKYNP